MSAESEVLKQSHPRSRASGFCQRCRAKDIIAEPQILKTENVAMKNASVSATQLKSNVHA